MDFLHSNVHTHHNCTLYSEKELGPLRTHGVGHVNRILQRAISNNCIYFASSQTADTLENYCTLTIQNGS